MAASKSEKEKAKWLRSRMSTGRDVHGEQGAERARVRRCRCRGLLAAVAWPSCSVLPQSPCLRKALKLRVRCAGAAARGWLQRALFARWGRNGLSIGQSVPCCCDLVVERRESRPHLDPSPYAPDAEQQRGLSRVGRRGTEIAWTRVPGLGSTAQPSSSCPRGDGRVLSQADAASGAQPRAQQHAVRNGSRRRQGGSRSDGGATITIMRAISSSSSTSQQCPEDGTRQMPRYARQGCTTSGCSSSSTSTAPAAVPASLPQQSPGGGRQQARGQAGRGYSSGSSDDSTSNTSPAPASTPASPLQQSPDRACSRTSPLPTQVGWCNAFHSQLCIGAWQRRQMRLWGARTACTLCGLGSFSTSSCLLQTEAAACGHGGRSGSGSSGGLFTVGGMDGGWPDVRAAATSDPAASLSASPPLACSSGSKRREPLALAGLCGAAAGANMCAGLRARHHRVRCQGGAGGECRTRSG